MAKGAVKIVIGEVIYIHCTISLLTPTDDLLSLSE